MILFTLMLSAFSHSRNIYTSFCSGYRTFIFSSRTVSPSLSIIFPALYKTSAHTCFQNDLICYLQLMVLLLVQLQVLYEQTMDSLDVPLPVFPILYPFVSSNNIAICSSVKQNPTGE